MVASDKDSTPHSYTEIDPQTVLSKLGVIVKYGLLTVLTSSSLAHERCAPQGILQGHYLDDVLSPRFQTYEERTTEDETDTHRGFYREVTNQAAVIPVMVA